MEEYYGNFTKDEKIKILEKHGYQMITIDNGLFVKDKIYSRIVEANLAFNEFYMDWESFCDYYYEMVWDKDSKKEKKVGYKINMKNMFKDLKQFLVDSIMTKEEILNEVVNHINKYVKKGYSVDININLMNTKKRFRNYYNKIDKIR